MSDPLLLPLLPQTALYTVLVSQLSVGCLAYALRHPLIHLFTSNLDVVALILQVMPLLFVCFLGESCMCTRQS